MKRNKGIITILVGVGILFISIFFSSGYHPKLNFIGNISRMEIVLVESKNISDPYATPVYVEGVAIPLKYPISFSVMLILLGTGIVLISKNKEMNA
ncbi:MAG: hypothetical protein HQ589_07040 [Syntrophaceae bacterium]|nr:hypothetical protein [Syntrophaceae bacterium]